MLHALRNLVVVFACGIALPPALGDDGTPSDEATEVPQEADLTGVTDRTALAFEESPAYYALLERARQADPADLREQARALLRQRWKDSPRFREFPLEEYPLFYDLTQQPDAYRGQPVSMRGHLIRLVKYQAGPNDYGIETLYEGWLVTPDAEAHPTTVIFTEIPEGMPIGEELVDGVSVTGYFFKLHTYSSRDKKTRFAPMVLAHTLQWSPIVAGTGWPLSRTSTILAIFALAAVGALVLRAAFRRQAADRQKRYRESVPDAPPEFLNDLTP
jgi:hypothetical protein